MQLTHKLRSANLEGHVSKYITSVLSDPMARQRTLVIDDRGDGKCETGEGHVPTV